MLDRDEIHTRLKAAEKLDPEDGGPGGEAYVEAMRSVLTHAEALGEPNLLFRARLSFAWALRSKPLEKGKADFFGEALPVLRRCLLMWHAEPHLFDAHNVRAMWNQLFLVVDAYIWLYPEPVQRLHRFLDELERYCPPTRRSTRYTIDHYRMKLDARRGDLDAVERTWLRLRAQDEPEEHLNLAGKAAIESRMWQRLGRGDRAVAAAAPLAAGRFPTKKDRRDALVLPYLNAGRLDEAVAAHQHTYTGTDLKLDGTAIHLEFCARTGNEERGLDVLHRNLDYFENEVATVEYLWTAAAAVLLCRRIMAKDLDREWVWDCACDDPDCDATPVWTYAIFASRLYWEVVNFAEELDGLNGTTFQSEKIRELLHAEPVTDDLPLPPDTAPPRQHACPPLAHHLPSAMADDPLGTLTEARALERNRRRIVRIQHVLQNAIASDDRELLPDVRLTLLEELTPLNSTWRFKLFSALSEYLRLHDAQSSPLGADGLEAVWRAVPIVLDRVLTLPTVHPAQIRGLLHRLEPHCRPDTDDLHHLRWFGTELEVRCGDVEAAASAWSAFDALPAGAAYATRENVLRRAQWWLDLGRDDPALEILADHEPLRLLPYLRAGRLEEARELHEHTYRTAQHPMEVAAHLEFCARTDELEHGKELILRNLDLFHTSRNDEECSIDRLRAYGSAIRLGERIVASGRDEQWTWPADDCCPPEDDWTYARFTESCRSEGDFFLTRWDWLIGGHATRTRVAGLPRP
ncbi:hypothetical protein [Actinocorallia libanotica]|uniref:Tetratricopeptide repeat protein n=1 Tax=Actinocorallia libanotica TaxID=46162 RepID=A0ABN1QXL6_9ACTN